MKARNRWLSISLLTLVALLLAACSVTATPEVVTEVVKETVIEEVVVTATPEPASEKTTLEVWTKYTPGQDKNRYDAFEEALVTWGAEHPNIRIKHVYFDSSEFKTTVPLSMESGEAGCLVLADIGGANLLPWYNAGYLVPWDDYAQQYAWFEKDTGGSMVASNLGTGRSSVYDGPEIAGVPNIYQPLGIFYNKDSFKEQGLTPPANWDDFVNILETYKEAGTPPLVFGNAQQFHGLHYLSSLIGAYVDIDRLNAWWDGSDPSVKFTDPDFLAAAQTAQEWVEAGYFTPDFNAINFDDAMGLFLAGEQPMLLTGDWNVARMNENAAFEVGYFPFPSADPDIAWTIVKQPDWPFVMPTWCEHKDEAALFMDFLISQEGMAPFYEQGMQPTFPFDASGLKASTLQLEVAQGIEGKHSGFYIDVVDSEVHSLIWPLNQLLFDGSVTPEDFAQQIQEAREKYLSEPGG